MLSVQQLSSWELGSRYSKQDHVTVSLRCLILHIRKSHNALLVVLTPPDVGALLRKNMSVTVRPSPMWTCCITNVSVDAKGDTGNTKGGVVKITR